MTSPLPNVRLPALKKKVNNWPRVEAVAGLAATALMGISATAPEADGALRGLRKEP